MSKKSQGRAANAGAASVLPEFPELHVSKHQPKPAKAMNKSQETYLNKIDNSTVTFCIGPAGTGKTYCAAIAAANAFKSKRVERIIISRPLVEAGEKIGFLPGDLNEKVDPYVAPFVDALKRIMGTGQVEALIAHEKIQFLPLGFMRGHSWDNSFVILDEAQNTTKAQMKLFLTRVGKGTKVIVDGDLSQRDLEVFGLDDALQRLANVRGVAIHHFDESDIVRSGIVRDFIVAYSDTSIPEISEQNSREGLKRFLS